MPRTENVKHDKGHGKDTISGTIETTALRHHPAIFLRANENEYALLKAETYRAMRDILVKVVKDSEQNLNSISNLFNKTV